MQAHRALFAASDVRELDRRAIEDHGIPGYTLMQRAGRAAWDSARRAWGKPSRVIVFCGPGNNGGDGYEIARLALAEGVAVALRELPGERQGDAARARDAWRRDGGVILEEDGDDPVPALDASCWVVDALLGTGLSRPPEGLAAGAIACINRARAGGARVLAVDVPSGLISDTGWPPGEAVFADMTVTFIGNKPGLHTGRGVDHAGRVLWASLEVPEAVYEGVPPRAAALTAADLPRWFAPRARSAHKNRHGHVLVVGGAPGMAGAALLAGRAALRSGAGLVSVATAPEHAAALCAAQPELMVCGVADSEALAPLLERATVVAIGPGLGRSRWAMSMFEAALARGLPLVVDADALHLLAQVARAVPQAVLTPHPGEAARLLGGSTSDVESDRIAAAQALQQRFRGAVVLKGAGTLVVGDDAVPALCMAGNPGMASGGSGDVLTGVVAACLGQGLSLYDAARAAVLAHAHAGDLAAADGERGMLPGDLVAALRKAVNPTPVDAR